MPAVRNLLILLGSGLRSDALEDERVWPLKTPNLRRLSRRGLRLVATSACPASPGGLVSLLTGLHARQHGYVTPDQPVPPSLPGLPLWLADAGYHVAGVGCLGPFASTCAHSVIVEPLSDTQPERCDYFRLMRARGLGPAVTSQRRRRLRLGPFDPDRLLLDPDDDVDGFIAVEARRMLERMPQDAPWALVVVFSGPGNDLPPPPPYDSLVDTQVLGDGFRPADLKRLDALAELAYPRVMLQRLEPHALARLRADYLGRVALIDRGVGRIVDMLSRRADRTRTWTVVASDTGYLLGEHGLIGRRSFLAGAAETPLLVAAPPRASDGSGGDRDVPATPPAADDAGLFSTVDVAATIAAIAGADLPPAAVGRSLLPLWRAESIPELPGGLLSEFNDRLLLETERFKTVFHARTGQCLGVFDLLNDPDEYRNLSQATVGQNLLESLRLRVASALLPLRAAK
jgi:arylsulfatase A-like enzyme